MSRVKELQTRVESLTSEDIAKWIEELEADVDKSKKPNITEKKNLRELCDNFIHITEEDIFEINDMEDEEDIKEAFEDFFHNMTYRIGNFRNNVRNV